MTAATAPPRRLGRVEFTALLAMSMALAALGIDMILPGFGAMRADFGLDESSTAMAGVITAYFLGMALAQLVYGPLADRFGRKPTLYLGLSVYLVGALASTFAPDLGLLLAARFIWGLGAAGPRVITLSVVRDRFEGDEMARAMSFIMAVFILVPVIAPTLGALVVAWASWRWVFGLCALLSVVMAIWAIRLQESLNPADRMELSLSRIRITTRLIFSHRLTMGYTAALTALFGVFISYLASSEILFGEVFGVAHLFPLFFGLLAAVMGVAMLANALVVRRFGARRIGHTMLGVYIFGGLVLLVLALLTGGRPPLAAFLVVLVVILVSHALVIPNFNTIAMQPMGAVAGSASAVIGTISTAGGAVIGAMIDRAFDGTIIPHAAAFLVLGLVAAMIVMWAERTRLSVLAGLAARGRDPQPVSPTDR